MVIDLGLVPVDMTIENFLDSCIFKVKDDKGEYQLVLFDPTIKKYGKLFYFKNIILPMDDKLRGNGRIYLESKDIKNLEVVSYPTK